MPWPPSVQPCCGPPPWFAKRMTQSCPSDSDVHVRLARTGRRAREPAVPEQPKTAAQIEQFGLSAQFDDAPAFDHGDPIRDLDRGQPVGDHDGRSVSEEV